MRPAQMPAAQPRAKGELRLSSKRQADKSALDTLRQSGAYRALFPRSGDRALTSVFVNTAGGLTGGDRMSLSATAGHDSRLTLTSQAAERIYRAQSGTIARVTTDLTIETNARLDWLPQETILFDRSALKRRLNVTMAAGATFLAVEPVVFGRIAMGETLQDSLFHDDLRITRNEELIFADAIRLSGDVESQLAATAVANGARALAIVIYVAPDAEARLPALRALMPGTGGASLIRPDVLFARFLAPDSYLLRRDLIPVLELLHDGPLPKTWTL